MPSYGLPQRLLFAFAGLVGRWAVAAYYLTVRIVDEPITFSRINREEFVPGVYAFWHAHQLSAVWHFRRSKAGVMISASRDGEYIARIARSLGFHPVRGSSSRGGAGSMKSMIQIAAGGAPVAITPDGPRGPRYSVHQGVLAIAQKSGRPIIPFAIGLSRYWELRSWDRFRIPKPFSKGYSVWGDPIHVPADADEATLAKIADELRERLLALEQLADRAASAH